MRDDIFTCAQKLTKIQFNVARGTKNGKNNEDIEKQNRVVQKA